MNNLPQRWVPCKLGSSCDQAKKLIGMRKRERERERERERRGDRDIENEVKERLSKKEVGRFDS